MLVVAFFSWWYGRGWGHVASSLSRRLRAVTSAFSAGQLLKTLFDPWRRIITYPGTSLPEKFGAWGDNLFSRAVGLVVRLMVLFAAGLTLIIIGGLTVIEIAVWPLLPIAIPAGIVAGLL